MQRILTRKQLNIKYVSFPVLEAFEDQTKENYIQFYNDHIKLLNEIKKDLEIINKKITIEDCIYNYRQDGCIKRLYAGDRGWKEENIQFRQRIYELTDFIFYSDELEDADKYLTKKETTELFKMIDFLLDLAKERLEYWKKQ